MPMQVKSYLRLAFVLSDNNAQTLRKNLEKMIALVLYDADKEVKEKSHRRHQTKGLEIADIMTRLKDTYGLEFSDNEILGTIRKNDNKTIVKVPGSRPVRFNITPAEREGIDNKVDDTTLDKLIDEFFDYERTLKTADKIDENDLLQAIENISPITTDNGIRNDGGKQIKHKEMHLKFKALLYQYFYALFNSNASVMQSFLGKGYNLIKLSDTRFTDPQKRIINTFLYWDNPGKDHFVFQMVSCCFDYCVLTAGKTTRSYQQVFNNKVFYLDTNVIFRLMGLNREDRRRIINAFITKCIDVGINVKVTNFTIKEIEDTIRYHVDNLKTTLGGNSPVNKNVAGYYLYGYCNAGFYETYDEWCKDKTNTVGDYNSFSKFLRRRAADIVNQFRRVDCDSFRGQKEYNELTQSLSQYKQENRRTVYEESVRVDVSNYLYVRNANRNTGSTTFLDTHHYMISTDHAFGDWARELRPGTVPIIVLPSVWYSIILQYAGRNDDDYTAFTRFLNFSLGNGENNRDPKKLLIFQKVLKKQEPNEIKNDVLFEIEERLKNKELDVEDDTEEAIDEIINSGFESVTQRRINEARKEEKQIADARIESLNADTKSNLQQMANKHEDQLNELKAEVERAKSALQDAKDDKEKAVKEEKQRIIDHEVTKRAKSKFKHYLVAFAFIVICEVACFCGVLYWLNGLSTFDEKTTLMYNCITAGVGLIAAGIDVVLFKGVFCGFDREKIRNVIRPEVEDEYQK